MNAILFPGQGSQIVGMGSEFYRNFEIVKKIFKEADDKLNYKISKIILESPAIKKSGVSVLNTALQANTFPCFCKSEIFMPLRDSPLPNTNAVPFITMLNYRQWLVVHTSFGQILLLLAVLLRVVPKQVASC